MDANPPAGVTPRFRPEPVTKGQTPFPTTIVSALAPGFTRTEGFTVENFAPLPSARSVLNAGIFGRGSLPGGFPAEAFGVLQGLASLLTSGSFGGGKYVFGAGQPLQSPLVGGRFTDPYTPYNFAPNAYHHPLTAIGYSNRDEFPTGTYGFQDPGILWRRLQQTAGREAAMRAQVDARNQRDYQLEQNRKQDNANTGTYIGAGIGAVAGYLLGSPLVGAGIGGGLGRILGGLF